MNIKISKIAVFSVLAIAAVAVSFAVSSAFASTGQVVTCSGAVNGATVTWTASSTGGNPPYNFLWSGDPSVSGATSTSITHTYAANGTYDAAVAVTDASSTTATSSCSATVSSIPAPTGTLDIVLSVNNSAGGSATPSDFTVYVSGGTPPQFAGSASTTAVTVDANTTYAVTVSSLANYSESESGTCSGPIAAGATATCAVTETYAVPVVIPPTPPTPPVRYIPSMLSINPDGHFLAHGMVVTSVASGSFTGTIWGITYTVNWSGNLNGFGHEAELWFRGGPANGGATLTSQIQVGDQLGVSGNLDQSNPLVVNADVVRDYSIQNARPELGSEGNSGNGNFGGGEGNIGNGNFGGGEGGNAVTSSNIGELQNRLQTLLGQFNNLEQELHGKGNGNGHGDNGHGQGGN